MNDFIGTRTTIAFSFLHILRVLVCHPMLILAALWKTTVLLLLLFVISIVTIAITVVVVVVVVVLETVATVVAAHSI